MSTLDLGPFVPAGGRLAAALGTGACLRILVGDFSEQARLGRLRA